MKKELAAAEKLVSKAAEVAKQLLVNAKQVASREEPYSNRELDLKFEKVETLITTKHDILLETQADILKEVRITNGKVKWHEKVLYVVIAVILVMVATQPNLVGLLFKLI